MKWFVFTVACVAALVTLGVLAVDERDVAWEGRTPLCGYCRAELRPFAVVCPDCDRSLDWLSRSEECRHCLDKRDVELMTDLMEALRVKAEPLPGALSAFPMAYFKGMTEGACTYCGGIGHVLEAGAKLDCPVCLGTEKCLACAGDRGVVIGDEGAARRLASWREALERAETRSDLTGLPVEYAGMLREAVRDLRGHAEAESLKDAHGRGLLDRAREKVSRAFAALREEYAKANGAPPPLADEPG